MSVVQLEDLVFTYPEAKKANFQTLITAKEEFRQTASSQEEPVPTKGQLFKHQEYLKRLMRQYDNQLVVWRTGTGKTCGVTAVTEYYKNLVDVLETFRIANVGYYKRAYVLVAGKNLKREFKFQLLCKCTDGDYINDKILRSVNERQRKTNITNSIKQYYTVTTYRKFGKSLQDLTEEQLIDIYSNSIFIVDEVHNLKEEKGKELEKFETMKTKPVVLPVIGEEADIKTKKTDSQITYEQLWRLFHTLKSRKVMLLSATPMINEPSELGPILNLLLPENYQLPGKLDWNRITLAQLEPFLRGYVSYVRELDTGAIPRYMGDMIDSSYEIAGRRINSQLVLWGSRMSELQEKTYNQAAVDPKALRPESVQPGAFSDLVRQAANFVFPDGSTGKVGYEKYITEDKTKTSFSAKPELVPWLQDIRYMRQLSNKYASIVELVKGGRGSAWIYSHLVVGSGAAVLGLCFEHQGFERFNQSVSIFTGGEEGGLAPVCSSANRDPNRQVTIDKRLRYGLLTGHTTDQDAAVLLEAFNSYENRHGEYIKAIIGSPVTRDGMNLANVLQIHLTGPGWNRASTYQAESRAIRSTSHIDLIAEEKERLISLGLDPADAKIDIDVYQHASITEDGTSIDTVLYGLSEKKDIEIKRIMRMLKQVATDCQIHYRRNVRANDIDGSAACDYEICQYKCFDPTPEEAGLAIDYSSYDVLYSGDIVQKAKAETIELFGSTFTMTFEELYSVLNSYRPRFIDQAVMEIILDKDLIVDRYGYPSYLREDNGTLFLRRDFPTATIEEKGGYSLADYTSTLIGIQSMNVKDFISRLQVQEQTDILKKLQALQVGSPEYEEAIDALSLENRIAILESAIYQLYVQGVDSPLIRAIIQKYQNYIYQVTEPVEALQLSATALANRGKGRGRKPLPGSKFKLTAKQQKQVGEALETGQKAGPVYIHTLYDLDEELTKYAATSKITKTGERIRILKPAEGLGWRDTSTYELPVYQILISQEKETVQEFYTDNPIYGIILKDGLFRIRKQKPGAKDIKDKRQINRGKVCKTWNKAELIDVMYELGIVYPRAININLSRAELINYLAEEKVDAVNFTKDKLEYFYKWYSSGMNRPQICKLVQEFMAENDLLFITN